MDYYVITLQILCNNKILFYDSVCSYSVLYTLYNDYYLPRPRASGFGVPAGFSFLVLTI